MADSTMMYITGANKRRCVKTDIAIVIELGEAFAGLGDRCSAVIFVVLVISFLVMVIIETRCDVVNYKNVNERNALERIDVRYVCITMGVITSR